MKKTHDSSNFWLGVLVISIVFLVGSGFVKDVIVSNTDYRTYFIIYGALMAAAFILLAKYAFSLKGRLNYLETDESLFERIERYQRDRIERGDLGFIPALLNHDDELEYAIKLEDHKNGCQAIAAYLNHEISLETRVKIWFLAAIFGNLEVIKDFVNNNRILDFNVTDAQGNNAVHLAVMSRHGEVVSYFAKIHEVGGIDIHLKNADGKTPQDLLDLDQRSMYDAFRGLNKELEQLEAAREEIAGAKDSQGDDLVNTAAGPQQVNEAKDPEAKPSGGSIPVPGTV